MLASSMVVYGEGRYDCPEHGRVRPPARAAADLEQGRFEPRCPRCGADLRTAPVTESAPLDPRNVYAVSKVAQEQLAGVWAAHDRRQRPWRCATTTSTGRGCRETPRTPAWPPSSGPRWRRAGRRGCSRTARSAGTSCTCADVAAANLAALTVAGPPAAGLRAYNVASGEPRTIGEMAAALAGALRRARPRR